MTATASSVVRLSGRYGSHPREPAALLLFGQRVAAQNRFCSLPAWNDGKVRVFAPESGRLMLSIHDAHNTGVTAIAGTRNCKRIISGGGKGMVSEIGAVKTHELDGVKAA